MISDDENEKKLILNAGFRHWKRGVGYDFQNSYGENMVLSNKVIQPTWDPSHPSQMSINVH